MRDGAATTEWDPGRTFSENSQVTGGACLLSPKTSIFSPLYQIIPPTLVLLSPTGPWKEDM